MGRAEINDAMDDHLHRAFESSQDFQRRIYRIARRGFVNANAANELTYLVDAMTASVAGIKSLVAENEE